MDINEETPWTHFHTRTPVWQMQERPRCGQWKLWVCWRRSVTGSSWRRAVQGIIVDVTKKGIAFGDDEERSIADQSSVADTSDLSASSRQDDSQHRSTNVIYTRVHTLHARSLSPSRSLCVHFTATHHSPSSKFPLLTRLRPPPIS